MNTIIHGVDAENADLAGQTVSAARSMYRHVFNIADDAIPKVDGKQVDEDHVLQDGQKLVFEPKADKFGEASVSFEAHVVTAC